MDGRQKKNAKSVLCAAVLHPSFPGSFMTLGRKGESFRAVRRSHPRGSPGGHRQSYGCPAGGIPGATVIALAIFGA